MLRGAYIFSHMEQDQDCLSLSFNSQLSRAFTNIEYVHNVIIKICLHFTILSEQIILISQQHFFSKFYLSTPFNSLLDYFSPMIKLVIMLLTICHTNLPFDNLVLDQQILPF